MTQTTLRSRLSKTNRADSETGAYNPQRRESRKQPLTERDGVTLREEARDVGDLDGDRPVTWAQLTNRFREYLRDKQDVMAVFESDDGRTARGSDPHRFANEYNDKLYAKLKDLQRGIKDDYGKLLHTAMPTLTASATPDGGPVGGVDHLKELLASWEAVTRALDRALEDRRYERLAILEPHPGDGPNNGYLHVHIAVFIEGYVPPETFQPVLDAHLRNCDYAEPEAHSVDDIDVRHAGRDRADEDDEHVDELAIYLAEYLGAYGDDDPLDAPEHVQAANALLWATGHQRWRPSNGAQEYMAYDPPESVGEWSLVGIEKDDDLIPADGSSGGVDTFTTTTWDPPP